MVASTPSKKGSLICCIEWHPPLNSQTREVILPVVSVMVGLSPIKFSALLGANFTHANRIFFHQQSVFTASDWTCNWPWTTATVNVLFVNTLSCDPPSLVLWIIDFSIHMGFFVIHNKVHQKQAKELSHKTVSVGCWRDLVWWTNNSRYNIPLIQSLTAAAIHFLHKMRLHWYTVVTRVTFQFC